MDWAWEGDESDEESKLRAETRKILELPELAISATCVRVPVLVGHSEAIWVEFDEPLSPRGRDRDPERGSERPRPAACRRCRRRGTQPAGTRCWSAGSAADEGSANGLALFLSCDNLRKGAALNAIQIAEVLLAGVTAA